MDHPEAGELDKHLPVPLYFQLKEALRKRMIAHEWQPGRKIPTEAEICERFGVSRITVRKALQDLQDEGYLERKQGLGTFVKNTAIRDRLCKFQSFTEELKRNGRREKAALLDFDIVAADDEVSTGLHILPGQSVFRVRRIRLADDMPYACETSYIPRQLADGLTGQMVSKRGLYASLASLGILVDHAVERLRPVKLDEDTANLLNVHVDEAAISLIRTASCGASAVEYCVSTVGGDSFSYVVELK
jgi:GntR family transcriptional regulator